VAGSKPTCIAWLAEPQVALVRDVAEHAGVAIVGAGSPVRGQAAAVAKALGAEPHDDLRATIASADADLALIASPGAFGERAPEDTAAILAARARGMRIASLEPIPSSALDLASGAWRSQSGVDPVDSVRFRPLARLSRSYREAMEVQESFGPVCTLTVAAWCKPDEGSLGARIYSALDLVLAILGEPETIDAAYVATHVAQGLNPLPGETLRDLHGDIAATLRFADGRAANVVASDRAGRWNREITMLGEGGRLRIFDDGFEWISPTGEKIDHSRSSRAKRGEVPAVTHAVVAIAEAVGRLVDPAIPPEGAHDHATVLAMAQAALLSATTGQAESPGTIRRLVGAG
jgi:hypothetical protein